GSAGAARTGADRGYGGAGGTLGATRDGPPAALEDDADHQVSGQRRGRGHGEQGRDRQQESPHRVCLRAWGRDEPAGNSILDVRPAGRNRKAAGRPQGLRGGMSIDVAGTSWNIVVLRLGFLRIRSRRSVIPGMSMFVVGSFALRSMGTRTRPMAPSLSSATSPTTAGGAAVGAVGRVGS